MFCCTLFPDGIVAGTSVVETLVGAGVAVGTDLLPSIAVVSKDTLNIVATLFVSFWSLNPSILNLTFGEVQFSRNVKVKTLNFCATVADRTHCVSV